MENTIKSLSQRTSRKCRSDFGNERQSKKPIKENVYHLHTMHAGITSNILQYLTKADRLKSDSQETPRQNNVAETIIPQGKMNAVKDAFEKSKAIIYMNDSTVGLNEKIAVISDSNVPDDVRKIGMTKNDLVLTIHTLKQQDIKFTSEEITKILSHEDKGVVGTLIENPTIVLSKEQVQEQWNKEDPFIRAMIIKSNRGDLIDLSEELKDEYNPNPHYETFPDERNSYGRGFPTLFPSSENVRNKPIQIHLASDDKQILSMLFTAVTQNRHQDISDGQIERGLSSVHTLTALEQYQDAQREFYMYSYEVSQFNDKPDYSIANKVFFYLMATSKQIRPDQLQRSLDNPKIFRANEYRDRLTQST